MNTPRIVDPEHGFGSEQKPGRLEHEHEVVPQAESLTNQPKVFATPKEIKFFLDQYRKHR